MCGKFMTSNLTISVNVLHLSLWSRVSSIDVPVEEGWEVGGGKR